MSGRSSRRRGVLVGNEAERTPTVFNVGSSICLLRERGHFDIEGPESTGVRVWPAAVALARFFERSPRDSVLGRRVLELGCGLGLVGLAALAMGAERVLLTDVAGMLPTLWRTLELNPFFCRRGLVEVDDLDWRHVAEGRKTVPGPFGLICWADCVHWPELFEPLCATLERLAGPDTVVLFSAESRGRTEAFLQRMRRSFRVFEVWKSRAAAPGDVDVRIFRGKRC
uniref:Calmodulin-lysine N-methyltransferase n=1 Tax=Alexandrium monilatum TaxID=311494 RepID=A0A7S4VU57_9DINO